MIPYIALCLVVAWFGRNRVLRFWGNLVLALIVTPLIAAIILILGTPRPSSDPRPTSDRIHT